ncbi:MAG: HD domain-containing protein [Candidatus Nanopelagicales bacterium]
MTVLLTQNYFDALEYASQAHAGTFRKDTKIPYICHPIAVSAYVLEAGGDEDQAIGALLHDVAEDCGGEPRIHDIELKFNERIAAIVRGCSDSLEVNPTKKIDWRIRKEQHLAKLVDASDDILIVTAADKLHNARAIATDFQNIGAKIWNRFNAKEAEVHWYYEEVFKILEKRKVSDQLLRPLEVAIRIMRGNSK